MLSGAVAQEYAGAATRNSDVAATHRGSVHYVVVAPTATAAGAHCYPGSHDSSRDSAVAVDATVLAVVVDVGDLDRANDQATDVAAALDAAGQCAAERHAVGSHSVGPAPDVAVPNVVGVPGCSAVVAVAVVPSAVAVHGSLGSAPGYSVVAVAVAPNVVAVPGCFAAVAVAAVPSAVAVPGSAVLAPDVVAPNAVAAVFDLLSCFERVEPAVQQVAVRACFVALAAAVLAPLDCLGCLVRCGLVVLAHWLIQ